MSELAALLGAAGVLGGIIGTAAERSIGTWSLAGLAAGLLMWLMRRWAKQRDDATAAVIEASQRYDQQLAEIQLRHEAQLTEQRNRAEERLRLAKIDQIAGETELKQEMARLRVATSKILSALMDGSLTQAQRRELQSEVMRVLFPSQKEA
jgi:hypothetical protein